MSEAKDYITDELGWSEETSSILSNRFAEAIFETESSGLEGVGYPAVFSASDIAVNLQDHGLPDGMPPADVFEYIQNVNSESVARIIEAFDSLGKTVERILTLTGSVVGNFSQSDIRSLLAVPTLRVGLAELDTPGELETATGRQMIGVPHAETLGLDGAGQTVAVIDGEVLPHICLAGRLTQKSVFSKHDWGEKPNHAGELFAQDHATSVATIIAGNGDSSDGITLNRGVSPAAEIWNYKIAPSTRRGSDVAAALEAAYLDGVSTINLSWGKKGVDLDGQGIWARTVDALFEQGVIVCKSAGNTGPSPGSITTPADAHSVISVGSTELDGTAVQSGSSVGPTLDGRSKPEIHSPGGGVFAGTHDNAYDQTSMPGTSFAAPFVAGVVLLIRQRFPTATAPLIRSAVLQSHSGSDPRIISIPAALDYVGQNV